MNHYPFFLVKHGQPPLADKSVLLQRPLSSIYQSFIENAPRFIPSTGLEEAINSAIAIGAPLLLTGEACTCKTQTAYYVSRQLGL